MVNCGEQDCAVKFDIVIGGDGKIKNHQPVLSFNTMLSADPLRYILFTSGSTGQPKGVQITASALSSFAGWYLSWPLIDQECIFMNQAPFSFDVSLCDLIGAFGAGAKMVLNDYATLKNGNLFLQRLKKYKANTLVCTPSFMQMYLTQPDFNAKEFEALRQVIFMGEELGSQIVKKLWRVFPGIRVVNAYGPTEATVVTTYIQITEKILQQYSASLPIGYCRPGAKMFTDHADGKSEGELCISGPHLSKGYLNDPDKTSGSFVRMRDMRTYRTGDLAYIDNELIFYRGRNDSQVKLNGYRIELDEISHVLLQHPSIASAAVVPLMAGHVTKKIIAFVVVTKGKPLSDMNGELREFLATFLPSYMIPSEFVLIDEIPLNANYKTDRKKLVEMYLGG
jgi:D-alanine--poly(phosphoribitol) ligase subunit 1